MLEPTRQDDPAFLALLHDVLDSVLSANGPERLFLLQIDNWFDHKWLGFSSPQENPQQENATLPPFSPDRILAQGCYDLTPEGYRESLARPPYKWERKPSDPIVQRRLTDFGPSSCFLWYSANTLANDRASVMVYAVHEGVVGMWFASFRRHPEWKLDRTKGISTEAVMAMLPPVAAR